MSFDVVAAGGGIGISLLAVVVVFAGIDPAKVFRSGGHSAALPQLRQSGELDEDVAAAIAFVLHAEQARRNALDKQRITLTRTAGHETWTALGKMRTLSSRLS